MDGMKMEQSPVDISSTKDADCTFPVGRAIPEGGMTNGRV